MLWVNNFKTSKYPSILTPGCSDSIHFTHRIVMSHFTINGGKGSGHPPHYIEREHSTIPYQKG